MLETLITLSLLLFQLKTTLAEMPYGGAILAETQNTTHTIQNRHITQFYATGEESQTRREEIIELIKDRATYYGVDAKLSLFIAEKESNFNEFAVNKKSGASGVYQWLKSSWDKHCEGRRDNRFDNINCSLQILSADKYSIRHWTADLNMRKFLLEADYVYCAEGGKNICELKP